jgi:serine phosphatase RsbU (regulator of sigma subunit)
LLIIYLFCLSITQAQRTLDNLDFEDLSEEDCSFLDSILQVDRSITTEEKIDYYGYMQASYESRGHYFLAMYCADSLKNIHLKNNNKEALAQIYREISMLHDYVGNYPEALQTSLAGLELFKELDDEEGIATSFNDIGVLHYYGGDQEEARKNFNKSLEIYQKLNDTAGIAMYYNNMANTLYEDEDLKLALSMYKQALEYDIALDDIAGQCITMSNIGEVYTAMGEFDKAEKLLLETLVLAESIDDPWSMTNPLRALGELYQETDELHKAIRVLEKGVNICKQIDALPEQSENYNLLYQLYKKNKDYERSLQYFELYIDLNDSLFNMEKDRVMKEMQAKYELQDKAREIELITKEKHISEMEYQNEIDEQNSKLTLLILGLIAFAVILIFTVRVVILKKKANNQLRAQNTIIQNKNEQLHEAYHQIEEKNNEILDSIRYAKRIQSAILPPTSRVNELLKDSFILYKPKDVVAGDFYWLEEKDGKILFAAADCTGHGVPGAMVSVVCNNGLNRSVREHSLTVPGAILDKTREIVNMEFGKSEEKVNDGMDIAICCLEGRQLSYAGAHNPLWIYRAENGEIEEIKANKQPIGKFHDPQPFKTHQVTLMKDDIIYIFSDGYADQFGGDKGKKMKTINFRKLLKSLGKRSMNEQYSRLNDAFDEWKGELEQLDDVCVIGVKIQ